MLLATLARRWRAGRTPAPPASPQPGTHLLWFCDAMLLFFALPWLTTRILGVEAAAYIGIEIALTVVFLGSYLAVSRPELDMMIERSAVRRSLGLALVCSVVLVVLVVTGIDATARPEGVALVVAVLWRGVADGTLSALLLVAFPVVIARELARIAPRSVEPWVRGFLSLVLVWALSAAHHYGFEQYDQRSLAPVEVTTTLVAAPMIVSASPAGSIVSQVVLHVAVVFEGYETDAIVPPRQSVVRTYEPPGVFPPEPGPNGTFPS